ncbi:hypothetical protein BT96DRAFT_1017861 [Gymnopus androsaceus JB14]|uniref:Uncharacterized protein n=1 Tax=Gymnopus androsaceus JB14 TaxID=1447944 RepID=A0A6A4HV24_9AGAR|nr:hypothetical protein BT96DRAFT_1017861 [Gymnopus androsaceus JB14]
MAAKPPFMIDFLFPRTLETFEFATTLYLATGPAANGYCPVAIFNPVMSYGHLQAHEKHFVNLPPRAHSKPIPSQYSQHSIIPAKTCKSLILDFPSPPSETQPITSPYSYPHIKPYRDLRPAYPQHHPSTSFATLPHRAKYPTREFNHLHRDPSPYPRHLDAQPEHMYTPHMHTHTKTQPGPQHKMMSGYIDPLPARKTSSQRDFSSYLGYGDRCGAGMSGCCAGLCLWPILCF